MKKIKLIINGRFFSQPVTGVQRYARELVQALDKNIENGLIDSELYEITIFTPRDTMVNIDLKNIASRSVGIFKGHIWEQIELPFYSRGGMLISLCNTGPAFLKNQIVTIHDASVFAFPKGYSRSFRTLYRLLLPQLGRNSKKILTDSIFSKNELVKYCNISPDKIQAIFLGVDYFKNLQPDISIITKFDLLKIKYIFTVSSLNPNKNFLSLVRAFELLNDQNFRIVIAGASNFKVFGSEKTLPEFVTHVGYVSDAELRALYKHAACFVFPSLYEGFGLPPIEAMACGCPVIVSKTAAMPEVCGNAALYCNPHQPVDISEKIKLLMNNSVLRDEMRLLGFLRAEKFTWETCSKKTWSAIEIESQR